MYSVQGLEYHHADVIIGPDLTWTDGHSTRDRQLTTTHPTAAAAGSRWTRPTALMRTRVPSRRPVSSCARLPSLGRAPSPQQPRRWRRRRGRR
ncbi:DNA/RNA helicase domain-containing protein [Streptomyces africanus]|uniref:DNA/RNA helicase domain-containing protein n=1 Tax=Streptomyces africanus TaxID=231024 RepID=UPI000D1A0DF7